MGIEKARLMSVFKSHDFTLFVVLFDWQLDRKWIFVLMYVRPVHEIVDIFQILGVYGAVIPFLGQSLGKIGEIAAVLGQVAWRNVQPPMQSIVLWPSSVMEDMFEFKRLLI